MPAHCLQVTAQSTADDLTSLLCSLLCYTLTSLLCTSCSLLRSGTLEQPFLLSKLSASESVVEYHFGITCDAARSLPPTTCAPAGRPQHQRLAPHHPQRLPSRLATACGTSEWSIFLGATSTHDSELEGHVRRRAPFASYDLRAWANRTIHSTIHSLLKAIEDHCHRHPRHLPTAPSS